MGCPEIVQAVPEVVVGREDPAVGRPDWTGAEAPAWCQAWGSGLSVDGECWALNQTACSGCSGGKLELNCRAAVSRLYG